MSTFKVTKKIGKVGKRELRLVSWNSGEAKYDFRGWYIDENGEEKPGKGITLSLEDIKDLSKLFEKILKGVK